MRFFWAISGAMSLAALVSVQPAFGQASPEASSSPASGQVTRPSLQDDFNKASEAERMGRCTEALPIFARLSVDPRVKPGSLAAGAIAVRRGSCLFFSGRDDQGAALIKGGLPILEKAGASFVLEVARAETTLGRAAAMQWQHDTAVAHFQSALGRLEGADRLTALMELAKIMAFDGGTQALAYVDEALAIASAQAKPDKNVLAGFRTIRGRILLNQGRDKEALIELRDALRLSGGLTSSVSLSEASMRGDLAQAALLTGDKEKARLYLAYTGAGRIAESPFRTAANMAAPVCGSETGLRPDDVAIVEFGIGSNGDVTNAQTVYSRGNYAVAAAFAQAVSKWYWNPADLAKIPPFFRVLTRVELRCSTQGANVPSVLTPLRDRFVEWAAAQLPQTAIATSGLGAAIERLGRLAEEQEKAGNISAAIAAWGLQGIADPRATPATVERLDRALVLATKAGIPTEAVNALRAFRAQAAFEVHCRMQGSPLKNGQRFNPEWSTLVADPQIAEDPLARDTVLLLLAPPHPPVAQQQPTREILTRVADDSGLSAQHPLRQLALLRLADLAVTQGKFDEAQSYFRRTGLSEQQCALIGAKPALQSTGVSGKDYPLAALMMGFEGWVRLEYDIGSDGRTANARPIIAYPAFVFVDAAQGMAKDIRYTASFRPSGGTACSANQETIAFVIPSNH